ncbi:hypothetical protein KAT63_03890 [Candidatus Parcubacteria bacterium]|nr:hypothetical protein [Candidatus Parcubacteria bacterium]
MRKIKSLAYFAALLILFSIAGSRIINAYSLIPMCQPALREFSNGDPMSGDRTFSFAVPPGGGTTCDTITDCPKISLPFGSTVFSVKADMVLTDPDVEIKTPYIWIPVTYLPDGVTENNEIKQISINDCSIIETYNVISAPSRTYVIPGGDVWVASRTGTDVSKLSPLTGNAPPGGDCGDSLCGTDETVYFCPADCSGNKCGTGGNEPCIKYKVIGNFSPAAIGGVKGITGDFDGNIWTANCGDLDASKLDKTNWPTSKLAPDVNTGGCPFGAIGDFFGHIWISNRGGGSLQCIDVLTGALSSVDLINLPYGISVDKDSNIYVSCHEDGTVHKYDFVIGNCPGAFPPAIIYETKVFSGTNGVAVDRKGYVWTANSHDDEFYVFINPSTWFNVHPGTGDLRGVAIDFDGYGWVVSYDAGIAYKYEFDDVFNSFNLQCQTPNLGGKSHSYSDMTGLRMFPKVGSSQGTPETLLSPTKTFTFCSDGTGTCTNGANCAAITAFLSSCVPDETGNCEISLEIFSIQAGNYTLKNLEVIYSDNVLVTTGGLIPCDRKWDDPATAWDDTKPCNLCHIIILANSIINFLMKLVVLITVLALVVGGLIYVKTSGDASLILSAKQNVNKILYGFVIIFIVWVIVNLIMVLFGFVDPLGDGNWAVFSCDL